MNPVLLAPLELVYASVVRARNLRFDRISPPRLRWPVVSIGNLSVGGAGKTPVVIWLARRLIHEGMTPDVLSRGYGRSSKMVARVETNGSAEQFGDEPLLIARATGVPVYVGASRYEAGLMAEHAAREEGRHVHLLDDGFQHRQLARDVDVVVIHPSDLRQHLLPAGRLREPLTSLKRADVIVLRAEDDELVPALRVYARQDCRFWQMRRRVTLARPVRQAMAFCGIARPDEFFSGLTAAGVNVVERMRFRDHHRYTATDTDRLAEAGKRAGCDAFVTTAKDTVKLDARLRGRLQQVAPLLTAELTVEMEGEQGVLEDLLSRLRI